jgi:hypothetical protein
LLERPSSPLEESPPPISNAKGKDIKSVPKEPTVKGGDAPQRRAGKGKGQGKNRKGKDGATQLAETPQEVQKKTREAPAAGSDGVETAPKQPRPPAKKNAEHQASLPPSFFARGSCRCGQFWFSRTL